MPKNFAAAAVPPGFRAALVRTRPGRPKTSPPGAKKRGYLLTDAEHAAVKALVSRLRGENSQ